MSENMEEKMEERMERGKNGATRRLRLASLVLLALLVYDEAQEVGEAALTLGFGSLLPTCRVNPLELHLICHSIP